MATRAVVCWLWVALSAQSIRRYWIESGVKVLWAMLYGCGVILSAWSAAGWRGTSRCKLADYYYY